VDWSRPTRRAKRAGRRRRTDRVAGSARWTMGTREDERKYSEDEVKATLHRALARGGDDMADRLSHAQLAEAAREVGIAPEALETAIAEERVARERERDREEWRLRRKGQIRSAVVTYLVINALVFAIDLLTP